MSSLPLSAYKQPCTIVHGTRTSDLYQPTVHKTGFSFECILVYPNTFETMRNYHIVRNSFFHFSAFFSPPSLLFRIRKGPWNPPRSFIHLVVQHQQTKYRTFFFELGIDGWNCIFSKLIEYVDIIYPSVRRSPKRLFVLGGNQNGWEIFFLVSQFV